jgi:hypothetical protein
VVYDICGIASTIYCGRGLDFYKDTVTYAVLIPNPITGVQLATEIQTGWTDHWYRISVATLVKLTAVVRIWCVITHWKIYCRFSFLFSGRFSCRFSGRFSSAIEIGSSSRRTGLKLSDLKSIVRPITGLLFVAEMHAGRSVHCYSFALGTFIICTAVVRIGYIGDFVTNLWWTY